MSKKEQRKPRPKMNKTSIKRLLSFLFQDYPVATVIVAVCIILSAAIGALPSIYIKTVTSYIEEGLIFGFPAIKAKLFKTIFLMIGLYAVALLASFTQAQIMARITQGFLHKMRTRMFEKMQKLPIRYFDKRNDGDIMSLYTNDIDTLRQLISQSVPNLFNSMLTIIVLLAVMIYYSVPLMCVLFFGIILMAVTTKKVGGNSAKYFMKQQQSLGRVEGYIEEMMHGQKVIKAFCHEEETKNGFDALNTAFCEDSTTANKYGNIFGPIMMNIGNILYVLVAFVGGILVTSNGAIPNISLELLVSSGSVTGALSVAVVASYLGMVKQFTGSINQMSQQINSVAMAMAGAERIFTLLDEEEECDDGDVTLVNCHIEDGKLIECEEHTGIWGWKVPMSAAEYKERTTFDTEKSDDELTEDELIALSAGNKLAGITTYYEEGYALVEVHGDVRLSDVDFGYEPDKQVLHDVSLFAKPGQKIAFVGATGAGKTTITNLINRFYDIADGKIRYDGININRIKKADLRRSLGVVLQDVNLFTGTVMENIRYGRLDATDEECIEAAKLANADNFIRRLPNGYDTELTSAGANLSQGQRQLLSIARAAVADPPVMIMDEATSSIDTRTESLVQRGMDALMNDRTVFVIAHRLSTVRDSNAIMVLDHGHIIERGNHDSLIAQHGTYYQLYTGAFELE